MGFRDKRYGVTWRTKRSGNATTVWFSKVTERNNFTRELLSNKLVLKNTIVLRSKNVEDDE